MAPTKNRATSTSARKISTKRTWNSIRVKGNPQNKREKAKKNLKETKSEGTTKTNRRKNYLLSREKLISSQNDKNNKKGRKKKRNCSRGMIYLAHLPHGFYEEQLEKFFSQFGKVTAVRVAKHEKTNRSLDYAYVEFLYKSVARVAAETMNGYLMFGKILKCEMMKQPNPRLLTEKKKKTTKTGNANMELPLNETFAKRVTAKIHKVEEKLAKMGIDFHFEDSKVGISQEEKEEEKDEEISFICLKRKR